MFFYSLRYNDQTAGISLSIRKKFPGKKTVNLGTGSSILEINLDFKF